MSVYNPHAFGSNYQGQRKTIYKQHNKQKPSISNQSIISFKFIGIVILMTLLVTSFLIVRSNAATSYNETVLPEEVLITISSGDTLWEIANRHYENEKDKGFVVHLIKDRNHLESNVIVPGQELILPVID